MLTTEKVLTRGAAGLIHLRFRYAKLTVCGYKVDRLAAGASGTACPRCIAFVSR